MADKNIGAYDSAPFTNLTRLVAVPSFGPAANVDPVLIDPDEVFPVEISTVITGGAAAQEVLWSYVCTRALGLPANLVNSQGACVADPVISASFTLLKNAVTVGGVTITDNVVSFALPFATTLVPGDALSLVSDGDALFDSVALSLRAIRN